MYTFLLFAWVAWWEQRCCDALCCPCSSQGRLCTCAVLSACNSCISFIWIGKKKSLLTFCSLRWMLQYGMNCWHLFKTKFTLVASHNHQAEQSHDGLQQHPFVHGGPSVPHTPLLPASSTVLLQLNHGVLQCPSVNRGEPNRNIFLFAQNFRNRLNASPAPAA